ncbi:hypothetical protein EC991775_4668 [Escherichia coli 99.1775]|nr:hypothetical protein EC991775_4668 [Escherichia coli 99.1775]
MTLAIKTILRILLKSKKGFLTGFTDFAISMKIHNFCR